MMSNEIRSRFLAFFQKRDHAIIPSASLVPENDPSVLFTTAGMQPLAPYLLGAPHPSGKRLVNVQKCVRTQDIDEVGDNTHDTFFEMLGNWSLGDYFKEDALRWSYEFLTSKEEGLGLDPSRLYVTVFGGNDDAPRDDEAFLIWKNLGVPESRIYCMTADARGKEPNWWSPGDNGPCGPDSEMFYDVTEDGLGDLTKEEYMRADDEQKVVEVWNNVFMEYEKKDGVVVGKLVNKNVDTGAGLERLAMVTQRKGNVFDTDIFAALLDRIKHAAKKDDARAMRIVADHLRTSVFLIADGVYPSNTDQGYILRRLLRRAVRYADMIGIDSAELSSFVDAIASIYEQAYPALFEHRVEIAEEISKEALRFRETLRQGMKQFEKLSAQPALSPEDAFKLYQSYGFPLEMTQELAAERGIAIDAEAFENEFRKHQELSRTASAGKFKGGLANHSERATMLHTATHLMLAGLRKYLGDHIHQAGSNITEDRTRFDFTHPEKVSRETLDLVEAYVNEAIAAKCPVATEYVPKTVARERGVEGSFWEKYPETVSVYSVEGGDGTIYSQELCGGPHVENTGDIRGAFRILKEEASSAGVRRIKATIVSS